MGIEVCGVVVLDGFATDSNVFATTRGDAGRLFARIPVFLRPASLFGLQRFLCIEEQMLHFSASLSNFFYWVDLQSIEDMGFIPFGVDDELDLLVPSNELFVLAEHRI